MSQMVDIIDMVERTRSKLRLSDRASAELLRDIFEIVGPDLPDQIVDPADWHIDWSEGYRKIDQEALGNIVMKECYRLLNLNYHKGN